MLDFTGRVGLILPVVACLKVMVRVGVIGLILSTELLLVVTRTGWTNLPVVFLTLVPR